MSGVTGTSTRNSSGAARTNRDEADLEVQAPPLYIQEKVHPKGLIDDLTRQSRERAREDVSDLPDLFADFNGLPDLEAKTEFYQHDQNWSNRMILGDALQAMASLAEREGLRGKVQCIYVDPPYGIKFQSNFQWSTTSRDVTDGKHEHITREPEQVRAFRDTWKDGIHSYLTYLRDRVTMAWDLLAEGGSIFVQIGEENVHRVRAVMDEVFGEENFVSQVTFKVTTNLVAGTLGRDSDYLLWYARDRSTVKYRQLFRRRTLEDDIGARYSRVEFPDLSRMRISETKKSVSTLSDKGHNIYRHADITSQGATPSGTVQFPWRGWVFHPGQARHWTTTPEALGRVSRANRLAAPSSNSLAYVRFFKDFPVVEQTAVWRDTTTGAFTDKKVFVVQTNAKVIQRCILMTTDPGDLVLDPTCGSGTTAYVAEQWGRRWITIDTSRVALALARARIMGARYPYYLLADSRDGQLKEAEVTRKAPSESSTYGDIRQGFVYERVPHITLKAIANNAEIDVIHERLQPAVEAALNDLNEALQGHGTPYIVAAGGRQGTEIRFDVPSRRRPLPSGEMSRSNELLEWEVPRDAPEDWPECATEPLARFWDARIARQREIDASIAAHADFEYLYDKPYEDKGKVRVAGPFTVESLTPHRVMEADRPPPQPPSVGGVEEAHDEYVAGDTGDTTPPYDFTAVILEQLRTAGVQQAHKRNKIDFTALTGWPGEHLCAEGRYPEGQKERRAGILIGPEHGTVGRGDLIAAAREAGDAGFDVLIGCAFNYDAQCTDINKLGRLPILKARMNADLHMSTDLKKTKGGNLFVIFGEPDIEVLPADDDCIQVQIKGIDLFDPRTGDVRSSEADDLACWFIDTDYETWQASSSATPTSWAQTIPTRRSRPHSKQRSMPTPGRVFGRTRHGPSESQPQGESPSRPSTTLATK